MRSQSSFALALVAAAWLAPLALVPELQAQETRPPATAAPVDPAAAEIRASSAQLVKAFEAGKAADIAALFSPQGELVDEEGNVYQGQKELTELFTKFFERFPGAKLALEIESIRSIGPNLAIEEGTRFIASKSKEGEGKAQLRYTAVRTKADGKWLIASVREFADDPLPTPHERLQALSWIVGDWVNEGTDGTAKLSYRWSEDQNFLLGDIAITIAGKPGFKSTQRIGWDPLAGKVRSWLFDADGGFAEGQWTEVDDGWVIKSSTVNPDSSTGSATITVTAKDKDHFTMKGTERIVGEFREPDFELAIARQPPVAAGR
ncbi:MAG: SgcJ/EcaC family oxidoreductase [Planctomycetaceae bacterium]|nr:SgcJ/EcaC family oxidoreductase [Planctomycetaceae bacterium]